MWDSEPEAEDSAAEPDRESDADFWTEDFSEHPVDRDDLAPSNCDLTELE